MIIYLCPTHNQNFEKGARQGCKDCQRILERKKENEKIGKDKNRKHLRMSVYWGKDADALSQGRTIENLEHKPIHFRNKDQFRDYLKSHNVSEAG